MRTMLCAAATFVFLVSCCIVTAQGQTLEAISSFSTSPRVYPEGLAFLSTTGNLWVSETGILSFFEYTTSGTSGATPGTNIDNAEGLHGLSNGNLLVAVGIGETAPPGAGVHEYTTGGTIAGGGISFNVAAGVDPNGVAVHPSSGNIWIADNGNDQLVEYTTAGAFVSSFSVSSQTDEPEGLDVDPVTGNLFVSDDDPGTGFIFEYTTSGTLVHTYDTKVTTAGLPGGPYDDLEGLAIDPVTGYFYLGYDGEQRIVVAQRVHTEAIPTINEWGMIVFSLMLSGIAIRFIRKQTYVNSMT